jgi:hypothetical protein
MADQPTPEVTDADVERIVRRDFPAADVDRILTLAAEVDVRERPRVVLACLKLAAGNVEKLIGHFNEASGYYREILGEAEYPLAIKRWFHIDRLTEEERQQIYDADWAQYQAWFRRV